jgi:hypothetical protein
MFVARQDIENCKRGLRAWIARSVEIAALHVGQCYLSEKRFRHPGGDRRVTFLGKLVIVFSAIALSIAWSNKSLRDGR